MFCSQKIALRVQWSALLSSCALTPFLHFSLRSQQICYGCTNIAPSHHAADPAGNQCLQQGACQHLLSGTSQAYSCGSTITAVVVHCRSWCLGSRMSPSPSPGPQTMTLKQLQSTRALASLGTERTLRHRCALHSLTSGLPHLWPSSVLCLDVTLLHVQPGVTSG